MECSCQLYKQRMSEERERVYCNCFSELFPMTEWRVKLNWIDVTCPNLRSTTGRRTTRHDTQKAQSAQSRSWSYSNPTIMARARVVQQAAESESERRK